ncbi:MAG: AraC family transcriptional regulator [Bacteroidales bacterium]|nr:AraC family transcriptional regulator [Bacteroidales bacterium]
MIIAMSVIALSLHTHTSAAERQWTTADGLPSGEIHQIVELPNGQMLAAGEGDFYLCDGYSFQPIACDINRTHQLPQPVEEYGYLWQGDSLLWLRDQQHVYLFDALNRHFRYDLQYRLSDALMARFQPAPEVVTDRQGGHWTATQPNGIQYQPRPERIAVTIGADDPTYIEGLSYTDIIGQQWCITPQGLICTNEEGTSCYNASNVNHMPDRPISFIVDLGKGQYLICDTINTLGYFWPERKLFVSITNRLPDLKKYGNIKGACVLSQWRVAVYTDNGAFLLDVQTDKMSPLPCADYIAQWSNLYHCMELDNYLRLWVGTHNGLFCLTPKSNINTADFVCRHVEGMFDEDVRNLQADTEGHIWAGTSSGICRIISSPDTANVDDHVTHFGPEVGIPTTAMILGAAGITADSTMVFKFAQDSAVAFKTQWFDNRTRPLPVALTLLCLGDSLLPLSLLGRPLELSSQHNNLAITFSALNYAAPMHTRYRYRMSGLDDEWHTCDAPQDLSDMRAPTAQYSDLSTGEYTFEVQAAVHNSEWGPASILPIVILPPMWLSWWALTLYAVLVITAIVLFTVRRRK